MHSGTLPDLSRFLDGTEPGIDRRAQRRANRAGFVQGGAGSAAYGQRDDVAAQADRRDGV